MLSSPSDTCAGGGSTFAISTSSLKCSRMISTQKKIGRCMRQLAPPKLEGKGSPKV